MASPAPPKPIEVGNVGLSSVFNGFFLAMNLLDLSINTWVQRDESRLPFLRSWYTYKGEQPIISTVMLLLLLVLPPALYGMFTEEVLGLWRRPAFFRRHLVGTMTFCGILGIITYVLAVVKPAENAVAQGGGDVQRLWYLHLGQVLFGIVMLTEPFYKHAFDAAARASPKSD